MTLGEREVKRNLQNEMLVPGARSLKHPLRFTNYNPYYGK
jgi:hypothetical protein